MFAFPTVVAAALLSPLIISLITGRILTIFGTSLHSGMGKFFYMLTSDLYQGHIKNN